MLLSEYVEELRRLIQEEGDAEAVTEGDTLPDYPEHQVEDGTPYWVFPS